MASPVGAGAVTRITGVTRCRAPTYGAHYATCFLEDRSQCRGDLRIQLSRGVAVQRRNSNDNWGTAKVRNTIGGRRAAMRVVTDRLNGMVVVYEQDSTSLEAGSRTLVMETQTGMFRLEEFPDDWRRLSDEALLSLRFPHS